jgi:hypothetical protein
VVLRRIKTGAIGHGVPVTPDERALSSWSFLTKSFSTVPFTRLFRSLSLAVVPRDEGPDFPSGPSYVLGLSMAANPLANAAKPTS